MKHGKSPDALKTPLDDPCCCFYMRRAARLLTRQYAETMKESGLKSSQFSILTILTSDRTLTISELASKMGLERTSLSRTLRPLIKEGLVLLSDEQERRRRFVSLTSKGVATYRKALPLWNSAQKQFEDQLGTKDLQTLKLLLKRTAEVVGEV